MKRYYPKYKGHKTEKQTRLPNSVIEALEDVIAILWEIIDSLADALLVAKAKAIQAMEILKTARNSRAEHKKIIIKKR